MATRTKTEISLNHISLVTGKYGPRREKTCLWGFRQDKTKPVSSATETS